MSTELATVRPVFVAKVDATPELLATVKATVFPNATDAQLALYFHDCERRGVHPLDRLLHPMVVDGKYVCITSIDLFRSRAGDTGEHAGTDDAVFIMDDAGAIVLASVTVYRIVKGVRCAFTATARWAEYYPAAANKQFMWNKMPYGQLAKCAEGAALRKGFPQQLARIYVAEEMDQGFDIDGGGDIETVGKAAPPASSASVLEGAAPRPAAPGVPAPVHVEQPTADWQHKLLCAITRHYEQKVEPPTKAPGRAKWINARIESLDRLVALYLGENDRPAVGWKMLPPADYEPMLRWLESKGAGNVGQDAPVAQDAPPAPAGKPADVPVASGEARGPVPVTRASAGPVDAPLPDEDAPPASDAVPAAGLPGMSLTEQTAALADHGTVEDVVLQLTNLRVRCKGARRFFEIHERTQQPWLTDSRMLQELSFDPSKSQKIEVLWCSDVNRAMLSRLIVEMRNAEVL